MDSTNTIVLDRDGVINYDSDKYIKSADEFIPLPGSLDAISTLHRVGYKIIVATNQSGLARGLFDEYALAKIHSKLSSMVEEAGGLITGVLYCPHLPNEGCKCRKPSTGLLVQAEKEFGVSLKGCQFIGDSLSDLRSALAFGMKPVLVRTGKGKKTEKTLSMSKLPPIAVFDNLRLAIDDLVATEG